MAYRYGPDSVKAVNPVHSILDPLNEGKITSGRVS